MSVELASPSLGLYWIPLGADTPIVAFSGRIYEAAHALANRRRRCDLYHAALIAKLDGQTTIIESAPVPDEHGRRDRGVVAEGAVGARVLGRFRIFRYEVRRWRDGLIPDLDHATDSPVAVTDDSEAIRLVLETLDQVPAPVWGRDEDGTGDMWNSNSVISWVLTLSNLIENAGPPPLHGRAPGWRAGIAVARRVSALPT